MTLPPESLARVARLLGGDYSVVTKTKSGRKVRHPYIERKECEGGGWYSHHRLSDADLIMAILTALAKDSEARLSIGDVLERLNWALIEGKDPLAAVIAAAVGKEG